MLVTNVDAQEFSVGKLRYWVNDDGASVGIRGVVRGETLSGDLMIPSSVNYMGQDYIVNTISTAAFINCTELTSVTIPNTVITIMTNAFYGCTSLYRLYLPNCNVRFIGSAAFNKTAWLEAQPTGLVYIGQLFYTYKNPSTMADNTDIILKDGTTCIADEAFSGCKKIASVYIPTTVKTIGNKAFASCSALKSVNIPASVTNIGKSCFVNCSSLQSIVFPNSISYINSNTLDGCTSLDYVQIPTSVKFICSNAFYGCKSLTNVIIPTSVKGIDSGAFMNCTSLSYISIPNSVVYLGENAFTNTAWYNSQPNGVVISGTIAVTYKGDVPSGTILTIGEGITAIANRAFRNLTGITVLRLPSTLGYIGNNAFSGCTSMTYVNLPRNLKSIGSEAFSNCTNLTEISFPNTLLSVGQNAFNGTSWLNYQPDGVVYAGPVVLKYNGSIPADKTLTIEEGATAIADYAFASSGFNKVVLPNSLTRIGYGSFRESQLQEINIPESVTSIANGAFMQIPSLHRVDAYVDPTAVTMGNDPLTLIAPTPTYGDRLTTSMVFSSYVDDRELHVLPGREYSFSKSLCWALFRNIIGDLENGSGTTGDLNDDGQVNTGDVSELYRAILNGMTDSKYDINGDGSVNTGDVSALYSILLGNG